MIKQFRQYFEPWRSISECAVVTAIVGSAVVGAGASMISSSNAASAQTQAADQSNARLQEQYAQTRSDLSPFREGGMNALNAMTNRLDELTIANPIPNAPGRMDQNMLEQTPGYQFTKTQGLKGVQNSAAARGLGASGAALKGAASFATGLADTTYQNQFNNANTNQTNAYNRLMGVIGVGQNAAAQTGVQGTQLAMQQGANTIGAGNAEAASYNKMGNAVATGANQISGYMQSPAYNQGYGSSSYNGLYQAPTTTGQVY